MTFILGLFQSKLARQIGVAVAAFLALVTFGMVQKRKGAKENAAKQERVDNENARNIRDRVRDAKRVSNDDIKYRD